MASKLIPSNPSDVMVIRNITPNVVTLSVPFARLGKIKVGGRATLLRLTSGGLVVTSPVALTDNVKAKVAELGGPVRYIVAPDLEHHIFVSEWAKEWPEAKIIGPEGLPEKRQGQKDAKIGKEIFTHIFEAKNKQDFRIGGDFDRDFDYEYVHSHLNKEIVLYYKPDKILVQADLLFNLPPTEQYSRVPDSLKKGGILDSIFSSLNTTQGEAKGTKRFLWYAVSRSDRSAFNASIQRIGTWDFTTMIPCHGDTIEGNAKQVFEKVFDWHLKGTK